MAIYTLSPRMKVIADFALGAEKVADIGCDHGKISVELAKAGSFVYAVDISEPSLQKVKELAKAEKVQEQMRFFCSDGLEDINNEKLDVIIIAGMGWRMISEILQKNIECVKNTRKLILQPMDNTIELREYLCSNNYTTIDEKIVIDEGRMYTVICAAYGKGKKNRKAEMLIGPKVIQNKDLLIPELAIKEIHKKEKKLAGLLMSKKRDKKLIRQTKREIKIFRRYSKR